MARRPIRTIRRRAVGAADAQGVWVRLPTQTQLHLDCPSPTSPPWPAAIDEDAQPVPLSDGFINPLQRSGRALRRSGTGRGCNGNEPCRTAELFEQPLRANESETS